jgi:hypothetical protein
MPSRKPAPRRRKRAPQLPASLAVTINGASFFVPTKFNVTTVKADVWARRPELAVHIAHISQIWNLIELKFAETFVRLARSDRQAVGAMFLSIQSIPTKLEMLRRLAADSLNPSDQVLFDSLCGRFRRLSKKRVNVIHGVWGINDDRPYAIFLTKNVFDLTQGHSDSEYTAEKFRRDERDLMSLLVDLQEFVNNLCGIVES